MAKSLERWVAKSWRDGWLSTEEVGSAPACYGSTLGSNPDIPHKSYMGDISEGVADTL